FPMKRRYRLRLNHDFQRVRRNGKFYASSLVVLAFLQNNQEHSRVGFVVNRRLGNAVQRNKIKRRMKETMRIQLPTIKPGFDLVFISRKPIRRADYLTIQRTITKLLKKADLLTERAKKQA
ncbi:ribonuclease P protein component, partial [Anaerolineales bacterium HSG25]|nr:ribonuclease P protein component [Anaerolineales bacterium HSG25]